LEENANLWNFKFIRALFFAMTDITGTSEATPVISQSNAPRGRGKLYDISI